MKYKLTIEADTLEEIKEFILSDNGTETEPEELAVEVVETEAGETHIPVKKPARKVARKKTGGRKKPGPKSKAKAKPEPVVAEPAPEVVEETPVAEPVAETPAPAEPVEAPTTSGPLTYEDNVRPLALKLVEAKNRDVLVALFDEFGVAHGKELKDDQFQPFIDAINLKLAG